MKGFRHWHWLRTFRPWHWLPKVYPGVNGVKTNLVVLGWVGFEYLPVDRNTAS